MSYEQNPCPSCGSPSVDMTCSEDKALKFLCVMGHRWELREAEQAQPEPQTNFFKRFLQRLF